ncbi:hypothetical protein BOX15_Mlig011810g1 [Macrostomum lignano]|uniref:Uncharacterized protein n=2 Tax=Macrostomum lignano TaxID=282301 RepID=A0A267EKR8_9PLAT|nr:hypothetical protein BOX15_Mlig011810g1 [Macrostomum lignano]
MLFRGKLRKIIFVTCLLMLGYAGLSLMASLFEDLSIDGVILEQTTDMFPSALPTFLPTVCANESCRRHYENHMSASDTLPIPKIRHILWRNEFISDYFAQQVKSWQRIHPDWTYVLWRDQDLEPFVAANFPELLDKFRSLKLKIMRIDMIRYMLLLKFGGVYADLDYKLVRSLDEFRRFYAVVTREPETHSLQLFGPHWPIRPAASPAFLMSAPGHIFFRFVLKQLSKRKISEDILAFAGPEGLTITLEQYQIRYPLTNNPLAGVYVPPSFSFYPYENNSLDGVSKHFKDYRILKLGKSCSKLARWIDPRMYFLRKVKNLTQLCSDMTKFNAVTDSSPPVYAIHDMRKSGTSWGITHTPEYFANLTEMAKIVTNFRLGGSLL